MQSKEVIKDQLLTAMRFRVRRNLYICVGSKRKKHVLSNLLWTSRTALRDAVVSTLTRWLVGCFKQLSQKSV